MDIIGKSHAVRQFLVCLASSIAIWPIRKNVRAYLLWVLPQLLLLFKPMLQLVLWLEPGAHLSEINHLYLGLMLNSLIHPSLELFQLVRLLVKVLNALLLTTIQSFANGLLSYRDFSEERDSKVGEV